MVNDVVNIKVAACGSCSKPLYGPVRFCPFCGQRAVAAPVEADKRPRGPSVAQVDPEQNRKSKGPVASIEAGDPVKLDEGHLPSPTPKSKSGVGKVFMIAALLAAGLWFGPGLWRSMGPKPPKQEEPKAISGEIGVIDTETVTIDGQLIKLAWVSGVVPPEATQFFQNYVLTHPGKATCEPVDGRWRCTLGGQNLSEVLLMSGLSCLRPGAPESLKAAASLARSQRKGVWSLPNPCSSQ